MSGKWSGGTWIHKPYQCFSQPGGVSRALYATACPCLAAGDVAARSGRTYFLDCGGSFACVAAGSIISPGYGTVVGCLCSGLCCASTRDAVVDRFGIDDRSSYVENVVRTSLCYPCHLIQELNEIDTRVALRYQESQSAPVQEEMKRVVPPPRSVVGSDRTTGSNGVSTGQGKDKDAVDVDESPVVTPVVLSDKSDVTGTPRRRGRSGSRKDSVQLYASRSRSRSKPRGGYKY